MTSTRPDRVPPPAHHAPDEALLEYVTGTATQPAALAIACHLSLCATCAGRASAMEAIGGTLIEHEPPVELAPNALDQVMARLDQSGGAATPSNEPIFPDASLAPLGLPRPLLRALAAANVKTGWRFVVPGVRAIDLPVAGEGTTVRLVSFKAGVTIPLHDHGGPEHIVVFKGALEEKDGRFARGDISLRSSGERHEQRVAPGQACVSLVINEGRLLPLTIRGRLLLALSRG
jgi:putative transcriptional regulator